MERKITKEIILKYKKSNKGIYCKGNEAFKLIWGTSTNPFDLSRRYKISKVKGEYFIPISQLVKRREFIKDKIKKLQAGLDTLNEAIR